MLERVCHYGEFLFDEEAANGRLYNAVLNNAGGGGVRAVRRAERVVYIDFGVVRKLFAEALVVSLFLPVEAEVFQKHGFALFERVALSLRVGAYNVFRKRNFAA